MNTQTGVPPTLAEAHANYWKQTETLVNLYADKHCIGYLTVWGMLADRVDEGDGSIYDAILTNHLSLYYAVAQLNYGQKFLDTAKSLFIK